MRISSRVLKYGYKEMNSWINIPNLEERKKCITADLDNFLSNMNDSWQVRFSTGLKTALIEKLSEDNVLQVLTKLIAEQHELETKENNARTELLKFLQTDPAIDSKMCNNDSGILEKLDKMVEHQQYELNKIGIPAFRVTQNKRELQLQSKILQFTFGSTRE